MLNRLLWDKSLDRRYFEIAFISRGTESGLEKVRGDRITRVSRDYVHFLLPDGLKSIPLHRIVYILDLKQGKYVYYKRSK